MDGKTDGRTENAKTISLRLWKIVILTICQQLMKGYIIGKNNLTKFHEDRKINVASRVLTRKNAPHPGSHVFQPTGIIFELFHEDRTVNVASRVKNAPPLGSYVFQANITIFELIPDIIETNLRTKVHEDWITHVASGVLARFY
ncbi:hypothetical protein DPMN_118038 [Dreissena polymorpha]|uniref:Uncharacterized protein n=1 Tax=Dreissena polymorpha TaxID=45954 RepID=A0A9D4GJC0_DREPO|nr:hypothetical protein DPMN_118038 [Dreissena polymorpha]